MDYQWHPLHLLQSPPHPDFPCLLSLTILRIIRHTAAAKAPDTRKVPIVHLLLFIYDFAPAI